MNNPGSDPMTDYKLWLIVESQYVDPWGEKPRYGSYYRVVEGPVEVTEIPSLKMVSDGYGDPWAAPAYQSADGRQWTFVQNRIDYTGGHRWHPHFLSTPWTFMPYEHPDGSIGGKPWKPRTSWVDLGQTKFLRLVNRERKAVDLDGNLLTP